MHPFLQRIASRQVPSLSEWIEGLGGDFVTLRELEDTPQDPEWHAEGHAGVHTDMVLTEMGEILKPGGEGTHLSPEKKRILALSALLHDVGKIFTTRKAEMDGRERIVSPRHPAVGRSWFAMRHHALGLPWENIARILEGIGHHHDPRKLISDEAGEFGFRKLARLCDLELVYLLALADLRGRRNQGGNESALEKLELFRLMAVELGLWNNPAPWKDWEEVINTELSDQPDSFRQHVLAQGIRDAEAGKIATPQEAIARSYSWRDRPSCALTLLCGPAASGKTTWVEDYGNGHAVVSLDRLRKDLDVKRMTRRMEGRVLQSAQAELRNHLAKGRPVIWDATSLTRDRRAPLIRAGLDYGAYVKVVAFSVPWNVLAKRNQERPDPVPESVLLNQVERFEWPFASEAHSLNTEIYLE